MPKHIDLEEFNDEMEEIDEKFGNNCSRMISKTIKKSSSSKKQKKFHKDGYFDKNKK